MKKYKPSGPSLGVGNPTVKKLLVFLTVILFSFSMISFATADRGNKGYKKNRGDDRYTHTYNRNDRDRYDRRHHKNHWRPWNHKWRGYHQRPPHGRYYHSPHYKGHWKSRKDWDRHYERNHDRYRKGRYHRDPSGFLMFKFCQEGTCFSFSIAD